MENLTEILGHYIAHNDNQRIFIDACVKANRNGWHVNHISGYLINKFKSKKQEKQNLYYPIIFSKSFSDALSYKLEDLGKWCDEGKKPLDFIKNLL